MALGRSVEPELAELLALVQHGVADDGSIRILTMTIDISRDDQGWLFSYVVFSSFTRLVSSLLEANKFARRIRILRDQYIRGQGGKS